MAKQTAAKKSKIRPDTVSDAQVLYLYGITPLPKDAVRITFEGVDGVAEVEPVTASGLVCWVSSVGAGEFADELAANMENLDWLAAASIRHQRVVAELATQLDVLPARFGTVFLNYDSLAADIKRRKRKLVATMKRISGADEWGVKVFVAPVAPAPLADIATSGADYLKRKAASLQRGPSRKLSGEVLLFASALKKLSIDSVSGGKVSGAQPNLEWQGSFLIRRTRQKQFEQVLRRFASNWTDARRIEATGPWPAYSFVSENAR